MIVQNSLLKIPDSPGIPSPSSIFISRKAPHFLYKIACLFLSSPAFQFSLFLLLIVPLLMSGNVHSNLGFVFLCSMCIGTVNWIGLRTILYQPQVGQFEIYFSCLFRVQLLLLLLILESFFLHHIGKFWGLFLLNTVTSKFIVYCLVCLHRGLYLSQHFFRQGRSSSTPSFSDLLPFLTLAVKLSLGVCLSLFLFTRHSFTCCSLPLIRLAQVSLMECGTFSHYRCGTSLLIFAFSC